MPPVPEAERDRVGEALEGIAGSTSRRGFIARLGGAMMAATAGSVVGRAIEPGEADAYHFCGHIFTTGSCPHPTGTPSIDNDGFPVHAADGAPVDNLGRRVNKGGSPVDKKGKAMRDPDGRPLPPAPRTRVCDETGQEVRLRAPGSTAAGTAVAAAGSASSSTAAPTRTSASTATRRSRATASPAARSSASCTSKRRCPVDGVGPSRSPCLPPPCSWARPAPGRPAASR